MCLLLSPLALCFGSRMLLRAASAQGGTKQDGFSFDKECEVAERETISLIV